MVCKGVCIQNTLAIYFRGDAEGGPMDINPLFDKLKEYLPEDKLTLVENAYQFALKAHGNQLRLSGEPFITHPVETAMIVADLQLDESSIAAALLHDVPEDCGVPFSEIESQFGDEVRRLVEATSLLTSSPN